MQTKIGISFIELHPAIRYVCDVISLVAREPVITSASDSIHKKGSLHYGIKGDSRCRAIDLRTKNLSNTEEVVKELKRRLGPDFDVVLEIDHLHIEYQPK